MKKVSLVLTGVLLTSGLCFAADQGVATKMVNPSTIAVKSSTAQGTIESISAADPTKNLSAGLSLRAEDGKIVKFLLATPAVYSADAKRLQLNQIKAGEKAMVKYSANKDGSLEARSIQLIK
ncbi:MAG: hypothetical protein H6753_05975 [Candidatus Omnitrophica bacterium]|nr:hypothetical protein [Candidatus Omnitrophota bacterium]